MLTVVWRLLLCPCCYSRACFKIKKADSHDVQDCSVQFISLFEERDDYWNEQYVTTSVNVPFSKAPNLQFLQWNCWVADITGLVDLSHVTVMSEKQNAGAHQNLEVHLKWLCAHPKLSTVKNKKSHWLTHWCVAAQTAHPQDLKMLPGKSWSQTPYNRLGRRDCIQGHCWVFLDWAGRICSPAY